MWHLENLKAIKDMEKDNTEILEYQNWGVLPLAYQKDSNCESDEGEKIVHGT